MQAAEAAYQVPPAAPAFTQVVELFNSAVEDGVFPGAAVLVARRDKILFAQSFGQKCVKSARFPQPAALEIGTVFDVAALTMPVVTASLCMKLLEMRKLKLEDKVARFDQLFAVHGKSQVTIAHLLSHTSGLAAWHPYFEELLRSHMGARRGILTSRGARDYVFNAINRSQLKYEPGTKQVYSDLGYMFLGHLIEMLTGINLERAVQKLIFQPLGMKSSSYVDLSLIKRRGIHPVTDMIAPTEDCPWRERVLCGEVHDDNAWAMGGIAGHSGLFTNVRDLYIFSQEMLRSFEGSGQLFSRDTVRIFWQNLPNFPDGYRLGWDTPNKENEMADTGLSSEAVGMNGFTGCSLWLEPRDGLCVIILSNRVNPSRHNKKILNFRPAAFRAIIQAASKH